MSLTTAPPTRDQSARRAARNHTVLWLLAPAVIGLVVTFALPLLRVVRMSLDSTDDQYALQGTFDLDTYVRALGDPHHVEVIGETLRLGLIVGLTATVLSYPVALFLARTRSRFKVLLIVLAVAPLLTSAVARTFGWIAILGDRGLINGFLQAAGLVDRPLQLSNNFTGAAIALVEIFMPYAILAMLAGFGRVSQTLEEAARSLGASPVATFLRITLPLSMPGVLTGFLLVFVLTISAFVTPRLLGGGRVSVLATEIYDQATQTLDWPLAASLAIILLVLFGTLVGLYQRATRSLGGSA